MRVYLISICGTSKNKREGIKNLQWMEVKCVCMCVGGFTLYVLVDYILQPIESLHDPDSVASFVPFKLSLR